MDQSDFVERIAEIDEDILLADGLEGALIGYLDHWGHTIALYDRDKCIEILMEQLDCDYDDAVEYFDFNVSGAYMGDRTPAFAVIFGGSL